MNTKSIFRLIALGVALCGSAWAASPGTAFTYQGWLRQSNSSASGSFNLEFSLWTGPGSGDSQVGETQHVTADLSNGLFTVTLDFGAPAFSGAPRWLQTAVRAGNDVTTLAPRHPLTPAPYALYALTAGLVNSNAIQVFAGPVTFNPPSGPPFAVGSSNKVTNLNADLLDGLDASAFWRLNGNGGTTAGTSFLGTTDNKPLELRTYGERGLRLESASRSEGAPDFGVYSAMNLVGGFRGNSISDGVLGGTIAGGGSAYTSRYPSFDPNLVTGDFGTVGGGMANTAGPAGTVPGGYLNAAAGAGSFAAGRNAHAAHAGSFVWSDGTREADSTGDNRFEVQATGGANFWTGANALWSDSLKGLSLAAADAPLITRGWDPFTVTAGSKMGLGRWGMFMEFLELVVGIPAEDIGARTFAVAKYHPDGTRESLITVNQSGNLTCKSLTILGGADLAEPFAMSDDNAAPGAVVVIDEKNPGRLKLSTSPCDRKVAGVVSGAKGIQTGISMIQTEALEAGRNVALSGRVYVLADASAGPIEPGDLLTTSATAGHAMKVTDFARAQGAILGKAMSGLKDGRGLVLALVTLQ